MQLQEIKVDGIKEVIKKLWKETSWEDIQKGKMVPSLLILAKKEGEIKPVKIRKMREITICSFCGRINFDPQWSSISLNGWHIVSKEEFENLKKRLKQQGIKFSISKKGMCRSCNPLYIKKRTLHLKEQAEKQAKEKTKEGIV